MKQYRLIPLFMFGLVIMPEAFSQTQNSFIRKGNKFYKEGDFDKSLMEYERAVQLNPDAPLANFNLGNALFRKEKWSDAEKSYDNILGKPTDDPMREKAFYNKGVALTKQKKLEESIEAYKGAVKLDPNDEDARINLQKALLELKKKNESQSQNQQKQEEKSKQKEKPKPQQSKLNKKEVERLLKALRQKEQEVQQKMQQNKPRGVTPPEKDW